VHERRGPGSGKGKKFPQRGGEGRMWSCLKKKNGVSMKTLKKNTPSNVRGKGNKGGKGGGSSPPHLECSRKSSLTKKRGREKKHHKSKGKGGSSPPRTAGGKGAAYIKGRGGSFQENDGRLKRWRTGEKGPMDPQKKPLRNGKQGKRRALGKKGKKTPNVWGERMAKKKGCAGGGGTVLLGENPGGEERNNGGQKGDPASRPRGGRGRKKKATAIDAQYQNQWYIELKRGKEKAPLAKRKNPWKGKGKKNIRGAALKKGQQRRVPPRNKNKNPFERGEKNSLRQPGKRRGKKRANCQGKGG